MHKRPFICAGASWGFGWGLVCEVEMGGWLLLGFRAIDARLGGVQGWIRSGKDDNG